MSEKIIITPGGNLPAMMSALIVTSAGDRYVSSKPDVTINQTQEQKSAAVYDGKPWTGGSKTEIYRMFRTPGEVFECMVCDTADTLETGVGRMQIMKEFRSNYAVIFETEMQDALEERFDLEAAEMVLGSYLWYLMDSTAPTYFSITVHAAFLRRADMVVLHEMRELAIRHRCEMPWLTPKQFRDMICGFDIAGILFCYNNFPVADTEERALAFDKLRRILIYLGVIENGEKRT